MGKYDDYDRPFWVRGIIRRLDDILRKVDIVTDEQTHLNDDVAALVAGLDKIEAELAAVKAQPQASRLDFSALDAAVARVQGDATPVVAAAQNPAVQAAADQPVTAPAPDPVALQETPQAQAAADATGDVSTFTPVETPSQPVSDTPVVTPDVTPVEASPVTDAPAEDAPATDAPAEDAPAEATGDSQVPADTTAPETADTTNAAANP